MEEKDVKFSDKENNGYQGEQREEINTDENISGSSFLRDSVSESSEIESLKEELQAQKDKYLRLFAEFDNFRKRTAKERLDLMQTASKEVIVSMLDVLDDCDRAEKQLQNSKEIEQVKQGVSLVFNKLRSVLNGLGVKAMESIHQDFDLEKHEAITEVTAPSADLKGKVLDEVNKGYYLKDKLIRFAKVVVGK